MAPTPARDLLRSLPPVEEVLRSPQVSALAPLLPHDILADCVRDAVDAVRGAILDGSRAPVDGGALADDACARALACLRPSLRRVVNATGVVVHTNLGRSPLADEAVHAVTEAARGYSTLEYDTDAMARGSRHDHVEGLLCALTGAEAAIAVNNNAAAVVMVLAEFAQGREAVVSRGELVEIGGSFRIPDIMAFSRARMVEVGATNKTHAADYERALTPETAMLLKVHPSNYRIVGFSEQVGMRELRALADAENERRRAAGAEGDVLVYEDQGSGAFINLACFGAHAEPTVAESLRGGCDLVSFSGDKLLGGPQAGLIVGKREYIERIKKHPLARALRLDKMTLAALHATLSAYLDAEIAVREIPTLAMLSASEDELHAKALRLQKALADTGVSSQLVWTGDAVGGGSAPAQELTGWAVAIEPGELSVDELEEKLRVRTKPIVARIHHGQYLLCVRTIREEDFAEIAAAAAEAIR